MNYFIIQSKDLNRIHWSLNYSECHINDLYCLLDQKMKDEKSDRYGYGVNDTIPFPIGTLMKCKFVGYVMVICKADNTYSGIKNNWTFGPNRDSYCMKVSDFQDYVIQKCWDYRKNNPIELLPEIKLKFKDRLKLAFQILFKQKIYNGNI